MYDQGIINLTNSLLSYFQQTFYKLTTRNELTNIRVLKIYDKLALITRFQCNNRLQIPLNNNPNISNELNL